MINHDIRVPTNQPGFFNGSTYPGRVFFEKKPPPGQPRLSWLQHQPFLPLDQPACLRYWEKSDPGFIEILFSSWWLGSHQPQVKNMAWLSKWVGENLPQSSG